MTSEYGRDTPSSPGPKLVPAVEHFEPPPPLTPGNLEPVIQSFEGINRIIGTASRADKSLTLVAVKLLRSRAGEWAVQELRDRFPALLEELDRLDEDLQKNPLTPAPPLPDPAPVEAPSIIFHGRAGSASQSSDVAEARFSEVADPSPPLHYSSQASSDPDVIICYGDPPRPGILRRLISWLFPGR
jgi:hypothetical protein